MNQDTSYMSGAATLELRGPWSDDEREQLLKMGGRFVGDRCVIRRAAIYPYFLAVDIQQPPAQAMQSDMPGITKAAALPKKPEPAKVEQPKHKPALAGFDAIAGFDHRPGGWGAV